MTANETFFDFFASDTVEEFTEIYGISCICDMFNKSAPEGYLQIQMGREPWIDYVISRSFGETHKAMITRDGHDFIFSVTAAKLPGDEGIKSAVFTDITNLEEAKNQMENVNLKLQNVTDTITNFIFYKDMDLKYVGANKAFCEFIGINQEDLLGKTDFDIFPQEVAKEINDLDLNLLSGSESIFFDEDVPDASGNILNLSTQKHLLLDRYFL